MRVIIKDTNALAGQWAANHIAERINAHQAKSDKPFVLGLPTGSTPLSTYKALAAVESIECENLFYRRDIGWRVL